jgi:hypothetical protein
MHILCDQQIFKIEKVKTKKFLTQACENNQ